MFLYQKSGKKLNFFFEKIEVGAKKRTIKQCKKKFNFSVYANVGGIFSDFFLSIQGRLSHPIEDDFQRSLVIKLQFL